MLSIKKNQRVNYITLLLLVVFVLLRVVQFYSPASIIGRRYDTYQNGRTDVRLHPQRVNILNVMDRYILELKDDITVPKIKFSGMVLYLMLPGLVITLLLRRKVDIYQTRFCPDYQLCAKLCVFRL